MFIKYQHVERLGTSDVDGIFDGVCHVFPKIDGTNGSAWVENSKIHCSSRKREISLEDDNQGFMNYIVNEPKFKKFFTFYPHWRLCGEWLVPHTIKDYRDDAWNKFYVFDVIYCNEEDGTGGPSYITYDNYSKVLDEVGIEYIPRLTKVCYGSVDCVTKLLDTNTYLMKDGAGPGEGLVVKNYDFVNRWGRTVWGKVVRNEFKEQNLKQFRPNTITGKIPIEDVICEKFCTPSFIGKEYAKFCGEKEVWRSKMIPEFLGRVWRTFIEEEIWNILKKHKNPTIDFKVLNKMVVSKIKQSLPHLF